MARKPRIEREANVLAGVRFSNEGDVRGEIVARGFQGSEMHPVKSITAIKGTINGADRRDGEKAEDGEDGKHVGWRQVLAERLAVEHLRGVVHKKIRNAAHSKGTP